MRRNLQPSELGDLLDRPLNAVLGLHRKGGSILLTPVWHLFKQGSFYIQVPGGDRKIAMLKQDPRCSILVAENEHPYRAIEASGEGRSQPTTTRTSGSRSCAATLRPTIRRRSRPTTCSTVGSSSASNQRRCERGTMRMQLTCDPRYCAPTSISVRQCHQGVRSLRCPLLGGFFVFPLGFAPASLGTPDP